MKNYIKKIKEIKEKPNGNALLFFGFYFIFFLVLILILKFSSTGGNNSTLDYEKGVQYYIDTNKLLANNFSYVYKVNLDNETFEFEGNCYLETEEFVYNELEYYRNEDNYFVNNPLWIKTKNPNIFSGFMNSINIKTIIESSTFDYKTEYESGKKLYSFLISTDTLNNIIDNQYTDFSDNPNRVEFSLNSDGDIEKIFFDLDNYCVSNKKCTKSLKLELEYDNYGTVKKIDNPIE